MNNLDAIDAWCNFALFESEISIKIGCLRLNASNG